MKRVLATLALLSCSVPSLARAEGYFAEWPIGLQSDVLKIARAFPGEFSLYVKDLSDGSKYTFNSATPMYLASGIKVAVMVALFKKIERGETSLDHQLIYKEEDVRDGAPLLSYLRVGTPVPIKILLEAMIQQSDNAATDLIIGHVGLDKVNLTLVEEGLFGFGPITTLFDVRRKMYGELDPRTEKFTPIEVATIGGLQPVEARVAKVVELLGEPPNKYTLPDFDRAAERYYASGLNTAPIEAMALLVENIVRGKVVSEAASKKMVEVMLGTETGQARIRGGLPISIPLAHKTGTQYRRIGDFGVFFLAGNRSIVFAAAVKGGKSSKQAEEVIGRLANRAYEHLATPEEREAAAKKVKPLPDDLENDEELLPPPPKPGKNGKKKKRSEPPEE
jgi:beta-lactamase class A